jgi:hypothetical protein
MGRASVRSRKFNQTNKKNKMLKSSSCDVIGASQKLTGCDLYAIQGFLLKVRAIYLPFENIWNSAWDLLKTKHFLNPFFAVSAPTI